MEQKPTDVEMTGSTSLKGQSQISKPTALALREEGRSLLPVSRVQKIIKADKELPIVSKEAVFVISVATEEFIKRMAAASQRQAERENRTTVQRKDFAVVTTRADEFFFLEDILVWSHEENPQNVKKANRNVKVTVETKASL